MPPFITKTQDYLADTILGDTGFFFHFSAFVLVNAILIAVNLLLTPDKLWFYWPLLGWGIGIVAHGLAIHFSTGESRSPPLAYPRRAQRLRPAAAKARLDRRACGARARPSAS